MASLTSRQRGAAGGAHAALVALAAVAGCALVRTGPTHPELAAKGLDADPLMLSDALEALIADGRDTRADREYALSVVSRREPMSAATAFARAAITGRVVQERGLRGVSLIDDVEEYARRSRDYDPAFRGGAATRLLGTLYVIAPASLLKHGDSETGLELLEELTKAHPDAPENHLRVAEAYISLHDPDPAAPHLCFCLAHRAELRKDDQALLSSLLNEVAPPQCAPDAAQAKPPDAGGTGSTAPPAAR